MKLENNEKEKMRADILSSCAVNLSQNSCWYIPCTIEGVAQSQTGCEAKEQY